jgi:hypothetical protein
MDRIDGYLSRRVQNIWPEALVLISETGEYIVRRPDAEDLGLGDSFSRAQQAVDAMLAAERAKKQSA